MNIRHDVCFSWTTFLSCTVSPPYFCHSIRHHSMQQLIITRWRINSRTHAQVIRSPLVVPASPLVLQITPSPIIRLPLHHAWKASNMLWHFYISISYSTRQIEPPSPRWSTYITSLYHPRSVLYQPQFPQPPICLLSIIPFALSLSSR